VTTADLSPLVRRGVTAADRYITQITPEAAGWAYSGLRIVELSSGGLLELSTGPDEIIVLPLAGSVTVYWADAEVNPRLPLTTAGGRR